MKRSLIILCAIAVVATLTAGVQEARAEFFGTTHGGGWDDENFSELVEVDQTTGAIIRTIGPVGYRVNGLAYDWTTGTLYGGTSYGDPTYNGLIEIDMNTGAGTPIGVHRWGLTGTTAITNITVNSSGQMYGWWDPSQDDLVSINKSTGVATKVGESSLGTFEYGLAFDSSDTLYLFNGWQDVYTVDPVTGATSYIGDVTGHNQTYWSDVHHGVFDLTTDLYYGISDLGPSSTRAIYVVDSSLSIISTLPTADNLHTLAFVPVPGSFILGTLGLGTAMAALKRRRRTL